MITDFTSTYAAPSGIPSLEIPRIDLPVLVQRCPPAVLADAWTALYAALTYKVPRNVVLDGLKRLLGPYIDPKHIAALIDAPEYTIQAHGFVLQEYFDVQQPIRHRMGKRVLDISAADMSSSTNVLKALLSVFSESDSRALAVEPALLANMTPAAQSQWGMLRANPWFQGVFNSDEAAEHGFPVALEGHTQAVAKHHSEPQASELALPHMISTEHGSDEDVSPAEVAQAPTDPAEMARSTPDSTRGPENVHAVADSVAHPSPDGNRPVSRHTSRRHSNASVHDLIDERNDDPHDTDAYPSSNRNTGYDQPSIAPPDGLAFASIRVLREAKWFPPRSGWADPTTEQTRAMQAVCPLLVAAGILAPGESFESNRSANNAATSRPKITMAGVSGMAASATVSENRRSIHQWSQGFALDYDGEAPTAMYKSVRRPRVGDWVLVASQLIPQGDDGWMNDLQASAGLGGRGVTLIDKATHTTTAVALEMHEQQELFQPAMLFSQVEAMVSTAVFRLCAFPGFDMHPWKGQLESHMSTVFWHSKGYWVHASAAAVSSNRRTDSGDPWGMHTQVQIPQQLGNTVTGTGEIRLHRASTGFTKSGASLGNHALNGVVPKQVADSVKDVQRTMKLSTQSSLRPSTATGSGPAVAKNRMALPINTVEPFMVKSSWASSFVVAPPSLVEAQNAVATLQGRIFDPDHEGWSGMDQPPPAQMLRTIYSTPVEDLQESKIQSSARPVPHYHDSQLAPRPSAATMRTNALHSRARADMELAASQRPRTAASGPYTRPSSSNSQQRSQPAKQTEDVSPDATTDADAGDVDVFLTSLGVGEPEQPDDTLQRPRSPDSIQPVSPQHSVRYGATSKGLGVVLDDGQTGANYGRFGTEYLEHTPLRTDAHDLPAVLPPQERAHEKVWFYVSEKPQPIVDPGLQYGGFTRAASTRRKSVTQSNRRTLRSTGLGNSAVGERPRSGASLSVAGQSQVPTSDQRNVHSPVQRRNRSALSVSAHSSPSTKPKLPPARPRPHTANESRQVLGDFQELMSLRESELSQSLKAPLPSQLKPRLQSKPPTASRTAAKGVSVTVPTPAMDASVSQRRSTTVNTQEVASSPQYGLRLTPANVVESRRSSQSTTAAVTTRNGTHSPGASSPIAVRDFRAASESMDDLATGDSMHSHVISDSSNRAVAMLGTMTTEGFSALSLPNQEGRTAPAPSTELPEVAAGSSILTEDPRVAASSDELGSGEVQNRSSDVNTNEVGKQPSFSRDVTAAEESHRSESPASSLSDDPEVESGSSGDRATPVFGMARHSATRAMARAQQPLRGMPLTESGMLSTMPRAEQDIWRTDLRRIDDPKPGQSKVQAKRGAQAAERREMAALSSAVTAAFRHTIGSDMDLRIAASSRDVLRQQNAASMPRLLRASALEPKEILQEVDRQQAPISSLPHRHLPVHKRMSPIQDRLERSKFPLSAGNRLSQSTSALAGRHSKSEAMLARERSLEAQRMPLDPTEAVSRQHERPDVGLQNVDGIVHRTRAREKAEELRQLRQLKQERREAARKRAKGPPKLDDDSKLDDDESPTPEAGISSQHSTPRAPGMPDDDLPVTGYYNGVREYDLPYEFTLEERERQRSGRMGVRKWRVHDAYVANRSFDSITDPHMVLADARDGANRGAPVATLDDSSDTDAPPSAADLLIQMHRSSARFKPVANEQLPPGSLGRGLGHAMKSIQPMKRSVPALGPSMMQNATTQQRSSRRPKPKVHRDQAPRQPSISLTSTPERVRKSENNASLLRPLPASFKPLRRAVPSGRTMSGRYFHTDAVPEFVQRKGWNAYELCLTNQLTETNPWPEAPPPGATGVMRPQYNYDDALEPSESASELPMEQSIADGNMDTTESSVAQGMNEPMPSIAEFSGVASASQITSFQRGNIPRSAVPGTVSAVRLGTDTVLYRDSISTVITPLEPIVVRNPNL